jgi:SAM-dependent methyltransferase
MSVGRKENFYIYDGYNHRKEFFHWDDRHMRDGWQNEVYIHAHAYASDRSYNSIFDIGCGSGFKLVKYFSLFDTLGSDREPTLTFLKKEYPAREWMLSDFSFVPRRPIDMVICADVIEHLTEPNELLEYIQRVNPKLIVLSTPDRTRRPTNQEAGPPTHQQHTREWNMEEFNRYVSDYFSVIEHFISNEVQATQCIVCEPKQ